MTWLRVTGRAAHFSDPDRRSIDCRPTRRYMPPSAAAGLVTMLAGYDAWTDVVPGFEVAVGVVATGSRGWLYHTYLVSPVNAKNDVSVGLVPDDMRGHLKPTRVEYLTDVEYVIGVRGDISTIDLHTAPGMPCLGISNCPAHVEIIDDPPLAEWVVRAELSGERTTVRVSRDNYAATEHAAISTVMATEPPTSGWFTIQSGGSVTGARRRSRSRES